MKNVKMNRIDDIFQQKRNVLNVYTTAGYPKLNDTIKIVQELANNGVDMVEIGMPFSDPLADGPTIQGSSEIAINNGITLDLIFEQIQEIRKTVEIPILLMGYLNQMLQYGVEKFLEKAASVGVDGLIVPDLPIDIFQKEYKLLVEKFGLKMSFLITPQTNNERIKLIANESTAFLYVVSSYATTGGKTTLDNFQTKYFERIKNIGITTPKLIGFGISNKQTFEKACQYANGAIIGSAFVKALAKNNDIKTNVKEFVEKIK